MTTKKMLLLGGIGIVAFLLYKKLSANSIQKRPGALKKFGNQIKDSITKPLDEVAADVPSYPKFVNSDW